MNLTRFVVTACLLAGWVGPASAGINIGMKLACKRYGEAWNSGSKGAIAQVSTADFAANFMRMPDHIFATMPRGGGGQVVGSHKGGGVGYVNVATNMGPVTFVLVGRGFNWTVADIIKVGDDGRQVSLSSYLDASLTSREFITEFKNGASDAYRVSISQNFSATFAAVTPTAVSRVRGFLPPVNDNVRPYITFNGDRAEMTVCPPGGSGDDRVCFKLKHEGSWKVDDFSITTSGMNIASFGRSIEVLSCVAALGEFVENPTKVDPATFASGELRGSLEAIRNESPFPLAGTEKRTKLDVSEDGSTVMIEYPSRLVRLSVARTENGPALASIETSTDRRSFTNVGQMLAMRQRMRTLPIAAIFRSALPTAKKDLANVVVNNTFASFPEPKKLPASDAVVTAAEKTAVSEPATLASASFVEAAPTANRTVEPAVVQPQNPQSVIVQYVEPRQYYQPVQRRGLFKRRR